MKTYHSSLILITFISVLFFGGCYTELQVVDRTDRKPISNQEPRSESSAAVSPQGNQDLDHDVTITDQSDYLQGYEDGVEDGWSDAESYFFKDYESERWYKDREINIWGPTYINSMGPSWGWRNTWSYYDPFWDPYWHSGFSFNFGWSSWNRWDRWGYWDPWSSWNSWSFGYPYGYSTYPSYGYGWGWGNYWVQNNYFFPYTSNYYKERALRDYGPRSTGLSSAARSGSRNPVNGGLSAQGAQSDLGIRTLRSASSSGSLERNREEIRRAVSRSATNRSNSSGSSVIRSGATSRSGSSGVRSGSGTSRNPSPAVRSGSSQPSGGSEVTRSSGGTRSSGSSGNVSSGQSRTKSEGSSVRSSGSSGSSSSGSVSRGSGSSSKPADSSSTPKSSSRNSNSRKGGN